MSKGCRQSSSASVGAGTVAVLGNPTAGGGRGAAMLPTVVTTLRRTGRAVRVLTAHTRDEALAASRDAVAQGAAALVAVGGDGTVHLALQAVAGAGTPLGIVPVGTGNDFAPGLGLPVDPAVAAERIAGALDAGRTRRVDLARIERPDGRRLWYGAVLAAGFDAIVNERANRMTFPRGPRRYTLAVLTEIVRLRARRYQLRLDGVEWEVDAVVVAVANTDRYGGGMRVCPHADPTDGQLDVVVGRRMGRATLARLAPRLRTGTHLGHPLVSAARARVVELAGAGVTSYVDGERAFALPVTVRCVPGALTLLG